MNISDYTFCSRKLRFLIIIAIFMYVLLAISGCESMDRTEKGAGIGALAGAGIGGIVGHQSGHDWEGAAIGGVTGALAGGAIGHHMDKKQKQSNPSHLTIVDIAKMGDDGVPSHAIIDEIKSTRSVYNLDSETIDYLKDHGIKNDVIDYMLSTGT